MVEGIPSLSLGCTRPRVLSSQRPRPKSGRSCESRYPIGCPKRTFMNAITGALIVLLLAFSARGAERKPALVGEGEHGQVQWPPKDTKTWRNFNRLVRAVERDDVKTVLLLVKGGIDVDGKDTGDDLAPMERPLLRAARRGNLTMVNILLKAGASQDWCCCSCITALHEAVKHRHAKIVRRLLEAGSDPRIPYDSSISTLDLAKQAGDDEILEMIAKRFAAVDGGISGSSSDERRSTSR
jgi:Ankyrin repeats (3 copies)